MNKNNLEQELKKELLSCNVDKAKKIAFNLSPNSLCDTLILFADEAKVDFYIYTFIIALILEKETAEYHELASVFLSISVCYIEGAYSASLYHAKKCLELEPDNIRYKQNLLSFYGLPDQVMSSREALKIALEIIKINPTSQSALHIIEELTKEVIHG